MNVNLKFSLRDSTRWLVDLVWIVVGVTLGLRFFLRLFNADASNSFVDWVYQTSGEILSPFRNMFSGAAVDGAVVDFTALFALVVYGVVAMWFIHLINRFK